MLGIRAAHNRLKLPVREFSLLARPVPEKGLNLVHIRIAALLPKKPGQSPLQRGFHKLLL